MSTLQKNALLILAIISCISLSRCDYKFSEINKVVKETPPAQHKLALELIPEADTIDIFVDTEISYRLQTYGAKVIKATYSIDDNEHELNKTSGSFTINPQYYPPGFHKLKLKLTVCSGSGSIADHLGAEGYYAEKEWVLKMENRNAPPLTPYLFVTENKEAYLKWQKCNQWNFYAYEVEINYLNKSYSYFLKDSNQTCILLDEKYIGQRIYGNINCLLIGGSTNYQHFNMDTVPKLSVTPLKNDSLLVHWTPSIFNVEYKLRYDENSAFPKQESDTAIKIPTTKLGKTNFILELKSPKSPEWEQCQYSELVSTESAYERGDFFITPYYYNTIDACYNYKNDILYYQSDNAIIAANSNGKPLHEFKNNDLSSTPVHSSANGLYKHATAGCHTIYVFKDLYFEQMEHFPMNDLNYIDFIFLSDTKKVFVAKYNLMQVYDIEKNKLIAQIKFERIPIYDFPEKITISTDGKYCCFATHEGAIIYQITNNEFKQLYSDERSYSSAYFDPQNPELLYLTPTNAKILEVRQGPNFTMERSVPLSFNGRIQNIDQTTGNMLLHNNNNLYILEPTSGNVRYKTPTEDVRCRLFNSTLYTSSGYKLNISEKIVQ